MSDLYIEQKRVAAEMRRMGGSFVRTLGEALDRADRENAARIKAAFPEYWGEYLEIADRRDLELGGAPDA